VGKMILHGNPNNWSCLPTAFAMVIGRHPDWFIQTIGHDGSAEPYKDKSFKAGFHAQECIEVLEDLSYSCTPIEIVPQISPHADGHDARAIFFGDEEQGNWDRLLRHLEKSSGVLTGMYDAARGPVGHAVAWDCDTWTIYDPIAGGRVYTLDEAVAYRFTLGCFWKVQNVKVHG
jgi:hypothetical protein